MGQMCGVSRASSEVRGPPSLAELVRNSLLCRYVDGSVKCRLECLQSGVYNAEFNPQH